MEVKKTYCLLARNNEDKWNDKNQTIQKQKMKKDPK